MISPSNVFSNGEILSCAKCGKNLLENRTGNIAFEKDVHYYNLNGKTRYINVFCTCKECNSSLEEGPRSRGNYTSWLDISDVMIPYEYLKSVFALMNNCRTENVEVSDTAYEQYKNILLAIAPYVTRNMDPDELERESILAQLPEGL